jgi:hypothetical protein
MAPFCLESRSETMKRHSCGQLGSELSALQLHNNNNNNNNNSVIHVPSQQLQGQIQTQHSVDIGNYIMGKHNISSKVNYRKLLEQENNNAENQTNKQTNKVSNLYVTRYIYIYMFGIKLCLFRHTDYGFDCNRIFKLNSAINRLEIIAKSHSCNDFSTMYRSKCALLCKI